MPSSICFKTAGIPPPYFGKFDNFGKATVHFCSFSAGDVKCARTLNLDQFQTLPVELRLGAGRIYLENERMVLLHIQALDALRSQLIQTLGTHRARGLLM
jgi:hypothetical protein